MTTPSHTELAARNLWETIKILSLQNEKLALQAIAAALESPERVQGEAMRDALESIRAHCKVQPSALAAAIVATCDSALAAAPPTAPAQYSLPDELYDSKDWKAADYAGRVEWLHAMYEAKKKELESFLSMAASPTAAAQDVHGQRNAQTLVDIGNAALRAGWNGVDMKAFVLARLATPSPQAEKQPLSEADEALMRQALEALRRLDGWLEVRHLGGLMPDEKALTAELGARLETSNGL